MGGKHRYKISLYTEYLVLMSLLDLFTPTGRLLQFLIFYFMNDFSVTILRECREVVCLFVCMAMGYPVLKCPWVSL